MSFTLIFLWIMIPPLPRIAFSSFISAGLQVTLEHFISPVPEQPVKLRPSAKPLWFISHANSKLSQHIISFSHPVKKFGILICHSCSLAFFGILKHMIGQQQFSSASFYRTGVQISKTSKKDRPYSFIEMKKELFISTTIWYFSTVQGGFLGAA